MIRAVLDAISLWAIPVLLVAIPLVALLSGVKVYDVFIEGAKEGFEVAVRIIPFLVGILVAIGMFRGSGAMDLLTAALGHHAATAFPAELVPLAILRSLSGSGSLASRRTRQDARAGFAHRAHRSDDVRVVGDNVLRARGVLRRGRRAADATRRRGRPRRRHRRRRRRGGDLRVDVLNTSAGRWAVGSGHGSGTLRR